jgi:two-component system sensor histidine kinase RegB
VTTAKPPSKPAGLDKPEPGSAQVGLGPAHALLGEGGLTRGRLTRQMLINFRWLILGAELLLVLAGRWAFDMHFDYGPCLLVLGITALVNLGLGLAPRLADPPQDWEVSFLLCLKVLQLAALAAFSGGVANPFLILLIVPVTMAASSLHPRWALAVGGFTTLLILALTLPDLPRAWIEGRSLPLAFNHRLAIAAAEIISMGMAGGFAWWTAAASARMELALNLTQTVLAREQRLSALGGLAAAAAHELGTPLATIAVVAKEMVREAPNDAVREDAELLVTQAERCREILRRLTEEPDTDDAVHARMGLLQFLNEVIEPHAKGEIRVEAVVTGPPGARPPEIRRMPEVLHAMTTLVENAVDFARSEVLVGVRFDNLHVTVEVRDDGPGFSPDILARLGQPYVTSRPGGENSRTGHVGMGLGFFIAKTLLERTGATVNVSNGRGAGASVAARWTRAEIEAPPITGAFDFTPSEPSPMSGVEHKGA